MSLNHSSSIVRDGLVLYYDQSNTKKSFVGRPTTNLVVSTPLTITNYAYCSGPVTATVKDADGAIRNVNRYTITLGGAVAQRARIVITPTTTGVAYTFSCKIKYNGSTPGVTWYGPDASKGNPEGSNNGFSSNVTSYTLINDGWYLAKEQFTFSSNPTAGGWLCYGTIGAAIGDTFDVYDEQFEVLSSNTPYISGIRSATQSCIDLVGINTLNVTNTAWDASNAPTYNASSSYIDCGNASSLSFNTGNFNISQWIKTSDTSATDYMACCSKYSTGSGTGPWIQLSPTNRYVTFGWLAANFQSTTTSVNNGVWRNISCQRTGNTTSDIYVDGVFVASSSAHLAQTSDSSVSFDIGRLANIRYFNGSIDTTMVYNRKLSAQEIYGNYIALRGRYGV